MSKLEELVELLNAKTEETVRYFINGSYLIQEVREGTRGFQTAVLEDVTESTLTKFVEDKGIKIPTPSYKFEPKKFGKQ